MADIPSKYEQEPTDHAGYNEFVQRVQSEAEAWTMETRSRLNGNKEPEALFEVYWDGRWHELGREQPFIQNRQAWKNEALWIEIQASAAAALTARC